MWYRCAQSRALAVVFGLAFLGMPWPALAQMIPTYADRTIYGGYLLTNNDGPAEDSSSAYAQDPFTVFDEQIGFDEAISGASASVQISQYSLIDHHQILARSHSELNAEISEPEATAEACASSYTYYEFTLDQPAIYHVQVDATGEVYGELRSSDYSFFESLDSTYTLSGELPAGDYVFDLYTDRCHYHEDPPLEPAGYDVRLLVEGQCAGSLDLADFSDSADVVLAGDAQVTEDGTLLLTAGNGDEAGAGWYPQKVNVAGGFETTFEFRVSAGSGADGFAFLIQDEGPFAIGDGGSGLGYGNNGGAGIGRSLAVEFDTFSFPGEFTAEHVSVQTDGLNENSGDDAYSLGHADLPSTIMDGEVHACRIVYTPGQLDVYLDGNADPLLSVAVDLQNINGESILDANGCTWLGFTAGTGGAASSHEILSWGLGQECIRSLDYPDFSNTAELSLVGDAAVVDSTTLRLTPNEGDRKGAAWHQNMVHLGDGFVTEFTFVISAGDPPADGLAFVIQRESPEALGGGGSALGYGNADVPGISKALAVEIDTFGLSGGYEIEVHANGGGPISAEGDQWLAGGFIEGVIADGQPHTLRIVYQSGALSAYQDGSATPLFSENIDLYDVNGGSVLNANGCAWVGFTAATGGFASSHDILNWKLGPLCLLAPIPGDDDGDCDVDADDLAAFEACASGPAIPRTSGCESKDFDGDNDVDGDDFGVFQRCYSGSGNAGNAQCAQLPG